MGSRKHPSQPHGGHRGATNAGRGNSPQLSQRNGKRMAGGQPIPKGDFALPDANGGKGAYPIDTPNRARDALARAKANATPAQQAEVKAAVRRKYPSMTVKANSPDDNPSHGLSYGPRRSMSPGTGARGMGARMREAGHRGGMMNADGQFDSLGRDD